MSLDPHSTSLVWPLILPILGAFGVQALGRWPDARDAWTVVIGLATFGSVVPLIGPVSAGEYPSLGLPGWMPGLGMGFEVEPLGLLFALIASGLWVATSIYGFGYMRGHHEPNQTRFFTCFAVAISATLGIAFAGDLVTLFFFYELLTFSTYPLVTHHGNEASIKAGRLYLGILVSTSILFFLLAIIWTSELAGTLHFRRGGILEGQVEGGEAIVLLLLFSYGIGKAALMPMHRWLPAAMVAPTPVSALLHAVAVVKAGVFSILKIAVYVFGLDFLMEGGISDLLVVIASVTILVASIRAIMIDNLKARLAYSTVSHLSYVVLGAALATPAAALGAGLHILMHALGKITLFFVAGAVYVTAHETEVSRLDGLGRRMPWTFGAFAVASLSLIGLPPLGGAWSKWYLVMGALDAEKPWVAGVLMLGSLLSIGYLMPIVVRAFFRPLPEEREELREASLLMRLPLCATAFLCVVVFFSAGSVLELIEPIFR